MNHTHSWTASAVQAFAFGCFIFLAAYHVLSANPFPFADEWQLLPYVLGDQPISWEWLWAQHVDHRIPLQKLIQVQLLRFSDSDFRILAFANAVFAYCATVLLLCAVKVYRGQAYLGDMVIPLLILNPGFGPFQWGFHFQFASSVFLTLMSVAFFLFYAKSNRKIYWLWFIVSLSALALCGLNGAILAGSIAGFLILHTFATTIRFPKKECCLLMLASLIPLTLAAYILTQLKPSGASGLADDVSFVVAIFEAIWHWLILMNPRSASLPAGPLLLYYTANFILYTIAITLVVKNSWNTVISTSAHHLAWSVPAGALFGALFLLLSIALVRSAYWTPGLEMHYGYLAVTLPVVSWVLLSIKLDTKFKNIITLALFFVYGSMYINNVEHAQSQFSYRKPGHAEIYHDTASGMSIEAFVNKYILSFYHIDTEHTRRTVTDRIQQLKAAGIFPYTQLNKNIEVDQNSKSAMETNS